MNEILENLKKSYSETRPKTQNFKFYSNLSVTQPYHRHLEIASSISSGLSYLQRSFNSNGGGFYSRPYKNPECTQLCDNPKLNLSHPETREQLTNILALELLGEELLHNGEKFNPEIIESIKNLVIPECGISTFNLFRSNNSGLSCDFSSDSSSSSAVSSKSSLLSVASSSPDLFAQGTVTSPYRLGDTSDDSGQDSPMSLSPILSIPEEEEEGEEMTDIKNVSEAMPFPDDCNTSSLAVSLLLREGILDFHPAASITELILSNTFPSTEEFSKKNLTANPMGVSSSGKTYPGVIRSFLNCQGIDPVSCANALYLFYLTDMDLNNEENVESTTNYLVETLRRLLTLEGSFVVSESIEGCGSSIQSKTNEIQDAPEEDEEEVQLVHNSPDALIFFLSRVTSISPHAKEVFEELLISLLDHRIGLPSGPLDLAMRILAADELNLLTLNEVDSSKMIRNSINKDYEALVALQDDGDGSWPEDSLISIIRNDGEGEGKHQLYYGSKELSTIFACKALDVYYDNMKCVKTKEKLLKDYLY